ncbi:MAG TPA: 23S rRNA (uracil(1939)-C(5))-methyltransferase RlmD [Candidatus Acidoferrales bacterium]|nr:23S rRNA (uracil(1939)-C(5))-methyltransferase RlmD [Candidatus Acidoferrales bacterium]
MNQTNAKSEISLEIDALSYGPYGIGRHQGKAVMIPATAPGDTVAARIVESNDKYDIGAMVRLVAPSPARQNPPCPYVGECGGCCWQHLQYEAQLKAKQRSVEDALQRIGKLHGFELRPIISSPQEYRYRRRIRLQWHGRRLGFYRPASHDLIEIDSCLIAEDKLNAIIRPLRTFLERLASEVEYVEVVTGDDSNQIVAVAKLAGEFIKQDEAACKRFVEPGSDIDGLIFQNGDWRRTWGRTLISIWLEENLCLSVDGDVFTQVNRDGNRIVINQLLAAGDFHKDDRVLELYGGAGNFTLPMAKRSSEVVTVENHRPSVNSGKSSAELNRIDNIRWIRAAVPAAIQRLSQQRERFSKIVLDPPRAGAKGIEQSLASLGAERILYISCNPTTLARDIADLAKHGYKPTMVQPIDLFPHTFHVETLAIMTQ